MDLSEPFRIRAEYSARRLSQYPTTVSAEITGGMQAIIQDKMQTRRMALASAWAFQDKMDTAQRLTEQLGFPVMPGESPAAATKRATPVAPKPVKPEEPDGNVGNAYGELMDLSSKNPDYSDSILADLLFSRFTPDRERVYSDDDVRKAMTMFRANKGKTPKPVKPTEDITGAIDAINGADDEDKLLGLDINLGNKDVRAAYNTKLRGLSTRTKGKFDREKWAKRVADIDTDNARADDANTRGDTALAAKFSKDAYDAARKAVNDFEEESGMRRKVSTQGPNGEWIDRYELDLSAIGEEERVAYKALIKKRDDLQKKVGVAPDALGGSVTNPRLAELRAKMKAGTSTLEEDAEFVRIKEAK